MRPMRAAVAALALGLLLVASGCGSGSAAVGTRSGEAASLVPPDALAFVSADANLKSDQWQAVDDLTGGGLADLTSKLNYERDVKPALGDELSLAVLGIDNGRPEAVAFAKPTDEAKLRALAAKYDQGSEHYTVERIGGWSVVADSKEAFDAVRAADSGRSLADVADFQTAADGFDSGGLAFVYAGAAGLKMLPGKFGALVRVGDSSRWVAARLAGESKAIRLQLHAGSSDFAPSLYRPQLLRDVPSGALLAVSFKNLDALVQRLQSEPSLQSTLGELQKVLGVSAAELPATLRGEGVFYVAQSAVVPTLVLELNSASPASAARALRGVAARLRATAGNVLTLNVFSRGTRVFLTNAAAAPPTPGSGLVDDQPFKDALAAADAPADVTWLAYADLHRLLPLIQALSQLQGGTAPGQQETQRLEHLGTLVAYGARSGSTSRIELRLESR
jgi:hypothetical protein